MSVSSVLACRAPSSLLVRAVCWSTAIHSGTSVQAFFSASGRCTLRFLKRGAWQEATSTGNINVDFCSAAGHTQPCGGGFSVDLRTSSGNGTDRVHLLAGLPLNQPHGRARIVNSLLSTFSASTTLSRSFVMHDIPGEKEHFGSSVAWASCVDQASGLTAVIASPSVVQGTPSVHGYTIQDDEGVGSAAFKFTPKDVLEKMSAEAEFGGFGLVVEAVSLPSTGGVSTHVSHFAVIIGAPYEHVPSTGANTGRVYIYCQTDGNRTALSGLHTLTGARAGEQFGYTISRLADVDGDGVEDIAIGAPALNAAPGILGRVYIYRVLPTCGFEAEPFQIIEAPSSSALAEASRGFGISISRGVDIDRDGGPEMVVTSLDSASPFYLFSMPRRLVARCMVSLPPKTFVESTTVGAKFTATFLVRLLDPATRAFVPLPKNFLSASSGRTHQINPDVLWQERLSQVKRLSEQKESNTSAIIEAFFASNMGASGAQVQNLETRLELDDAPISATPAGNNAMQVKVGFRTRISGEQMELNLVPLKIAYRYHLSDPRCSSYSTDGGNCGKGEQPLVDWSACLYTFPVGKPICAPSAPCEADLSVLGRWVDVAAQNSSTTNANIDNVTLVKIPYGAAGTFNRKLELTIRNNGPTKSSSVRVELRALGWPQNDTIPGIRGKFVSIKVRNPKNGALLAIYGAGGSRVPPPTRGRPLRPRWSIAVSSNEAAALITSKADTWLYTNEEVLLEVGFFLSGLGRVQDQLSSDAVIAQGNLPSPGIQANVSSTTSDAQPSNNVATVLYQIVYKPNIVIGAGEALPTLVDDRKHAPKLKAGVSSKVFAHELGPRLEHVFLIENTGNPEIHNATLQLDIPISTSSGDLFVYLSDRVRRKPNEHSSLEWVSTLPKVVSADGRVAGKCTIDSNFVDPLNITVMDISLEGHAEVSRRSRRSADAVEASPITSPIGVEEEEDNTVTRAYFTRSCLRQVLIQCSSFSASSSPMGPENKYTDGTEKAQRIGDCTAVTAFDISVVCARVVCHLNKMAPSDTVRLHMSGWLMASTFFKHNLPDVKFVTRLSLLNWGDLPPSVSAYTNLSGSPEQAAVPGDSVAVLLDFPSPKPTYEMAQSVVFRNASPRRLARMPLWPIIAGIVVGSIILVTVISLLYYCGFFSRRKRTRAARRRAELTASYRRSIIAAGGAGAGGAGGFVGPAASKPDFLLPPPEKNAAQARNGGHRFEREKGLYAAVPMVEGSADLVYAVSPEPPSPCSPEKEEFEPELAAPSEAGVFISSTDQLIQHSPPAGEHVNTAHSTSDLDTFEQLDDGDSSPEVMLKTDRLADKVEEVVEPALSGEPSELPSADTANTSGATQDEHLPDWLVGELEEIKRRTETTKPASSD
uniref:Integrin alpha third immunoglobulin-like domain-containing protein n=1 Tax=Schistocephalus solidus TaxID=70667 RepID=A0A0X3Q9D2_SCHSO